MKNLHFSINMLLLLSVFVLAGSAQGKSEIITGNAGSRILAEDYGVFNQPWAMTFAGEQELLVTERTGSLILYNIESGRRIQVSGVPQTAYGGQGGLGDVILHPGYMDNKIIYISYAEAGSSGLSGAAVARAVLERSGDSASLKDLEVIWRQYPKVSGTGHYSHRLVFDQDGYLYISSGERQKQQPAQDWSQNLGKIIRLKDNGTVPEDNPFYYKGKLAESFWTLGHRNVLGLAFDSRWQLWAVEMGPRHGDELNRIIRGENYGWPLVSWGNQYSGADIPDHDTRPEFYAPDEYWVPSIAPSGLIIYDDELFQGWQDNALIGGLVSQSLVRVNTSGGKAFEAERFSMGRRIREVEQGPDGAVWILEDRDGARLRRLTPAD